MAPRRVRGWAALVTVRTRVVPVPSLWTEAKIELLRKLWEEQRSSAVIAGELGEGFTRNSVLGKAWRLGLPRQREVTVTARSPRERRARPERAVIAFTPKPKPSLPPATPLPPMARRLKLLDLTHDTCHWPYGDPRSEQFFFCGVSTGGETYCPFHLRKAYVRSAQQRTG